MATISSCKDRFGLQALSRWPFDSFPGSLVCPPVSQDTLMYMDVKVFVRADTFRVSELTLNMYICLQPASVCPPEVQHSATKSISYSYSCANKGTEKLGRIY